MIPIDTIVSIKSGDEYVVNTPGNSASLKSLQMIGSEWSLQALKTMQANTASSGSRKRMRHLHFRSPQGIARRKAGHFQWS